MGKPQSLSSDEAGFKINAQAEPDREWDAPNAFDQKSVFPRRIKAIQASGQVAMSTRAT
jgi:hypothetical protein